MPNPQRKVKKGEKFGLRTALGESISTRAPNGDIVRLEKCKCECGLEKYVRRGHLLKGNSNGCTSCRIKKPKQICDERFYMIYYSMRSRCNNIKDTSYATYGKRGIRCERKTFKDFERDMYPSYLDHVAKYGVKDTTIDRIDNDGDYCKENCRRATYKEQAENKSTTIKVLENGVAFNSLKEFCNVKGYTYSTRQKKIQKQGTKNLII